MTREQVTITEAFAQWASKSSIEELEDFAMVSLDVLYELEENDYFGTEGLNKRFA